MNQIGITLKLNPCKEDPTDYKDFSARAVMGIPKEPMPQKYIVFDEIEEEVKREDQDGSGSCVGQSFSKYAEILHYFDVNVLPDLSARFPYSQIYLPSGGAYSREAAKLLVEKGCSEERFCPSYPATEKHMREEPSEEAFKNAIKYQAKSYARDYYGDDIEFMARMIYENHGFITGAYISREGWSSGPRVRPPKEGESSGGHSIYPIGYDLDKGRIIFFHAWGADWGDNGLGYFDEEYIQSGKLFNIWTLVDKPNNMDILKQKIDEELLELLYKVIHRRKPGGGAEHWIGKTLGEFLTEVQESPEFKHYSQVFEVVKELENWARGEVSKKKYNYDIASTGDSYFEYDGDYPQGSGTTNINVNYE